VLFEKIGGDNMLFQVKSGNSIQKKIAQTIKRAMVG
jgi:hypothetical protein